MSGLIFSLLLGAASITALIQALKDELNFDEVAEGRGLRGYIEEDGYRVEVFVKKGENQIQFITPDLSVPEDVCKKTIKSLVARLCTVTSERKFSSDDIVIAGPAYSFCHYCLEPASELLFRCKRCGGLFCGKHRFPERHNCPGGLIGLKVKQERKEKFKEEKKYSKKIILKEAPCG